MGQGVTDMIENAVDGTLLGVLYLYRKSSRAAPIIFYGIEVLPAPALRASRHRKSDFHERKFPVQVKSSR